MGGQDHQAHVQVCTSLQRLDIPHLVTSTELILLTVITWDQLGHLET